MPIVLADRVSDTTTTTGTGALTLAGTPPTGLQSFQAGVGVGNQTYYAIQHQSLAAWEVGVGTLTSAINFTRDTVLASSNAGEAVDFSSGTKDVFVTIPAEKLIHAGSAATETVGGIAEIATQAETVAGTDDQRIVTSAKLAGYTNGLTEIGEVDGSADYLLIWDESEGAMHKVHPAGISTTNTAQLHAAMAAFS